MTAFVKSLTAGLLICGLALPVFTLPASAETAPVALDPAAATAVQVSPTQGGTSQGGAEIDAAQALVGQQVTSADGQVVGLVQTAEAMDDGSLRVTVAVAGSDESFAFNVLATTEAKDALRLELTQAELLSSLGIKLKV